MVCSWSRFNCTASLTLLLGVLAATVQLIHGEVYTLSMLTNPAGCYGGEICSVQPVVAVLNSLQQIQFNFVGSVYAVLGQSPSGYEALYFGDSCNNSTCGQVVIGTLASATFVNGIATFDSLYLKAAGEDYILRFVGRSSSYEMFAQVDSAPFEVEVGPLFKMLITSGPQNAFGGEAFTADTAVSFVDRGDNVVETENDATVEAVLTSSPTGAEQLLPDDKRIARVLDGVAVFRDLHINEAGLQYRITFSTDKENIDIVTSDYFSVAVGRPAQLQFVPSTQLSASAKFAGEFFVVPPRLRLLDRGGNFVHYDSSSAVGVTVVRNPVGGEFLSPFETTFPIARQGVVTFSGVLLTKPAVDYRLLFTLHDYSFLHNNYTETDVAIMTEKFTVQEGRPSRLEVVVAADDAWAGNQAFGVQPMVRVSDKFRNTLLLDYETVLHCDIVESLAVRKDVVINTTQAEPASVASVTVNLHNATYGAGEVVLIEVNFTAHVWVRDDNTRNVKPFLLLNLANHSSNLDAKDNYPAKAVLASEVNKPTRSLQFHYLLREGDIASIAFNGQYFGLRDENALQLNNSRIVDGNNNNANLTITYSYLTFNDTVQVDTRAPFITELDTDKPDGEYGAGENLLIRVRFNTPVRVVGLPYLLLNLSVDATNYTLYNQHLALYNNTDNVTVYSNVAVANYSHSSIDQHDLYFLYTAQSFHYMRGLVLASAEVLLFNTTYYAVNTTSTDFYSEQLDNNTLSAYTTLVPSIKRESSLPITYAQLNISYQLRQDLQDTHNIVIDSSPPVLNATFGVQTRIADGVYYPGELLVLLVQFDKPVVCYGTGIFLRLDVGQSHSPLPKHAGRAWFHQLLNDSRTVEFYYFVENNANASQLDIVSDGLALRIWQEDAFIKRDGTNPTTDANLNSSHLLHSGTAPANGKSLKDYSAIRLDGSQQRVVNVTLLDTTPSSASTLYPDDTVDILVKFSAPVVANCTPVFLMAVLYFREAVYVSGNNTDSFLFRYTVQVGDYASNRIAHRHTPNALCVAPGCPHPSATTCRMNVVSTHPSAAVDLTLARPNTDGNSILNGVLMANATSISPTSVTRNTTVVSIATQQLPGFYGAGSVIRFDVTFSDIVVINTAQRNAAHYPRLRLNTGRSALYSYGNNARTLTFTYITQDTDAISNSTELMPQSVSCLDTAIQCLLADGCFVRNQADQNVDLNSSSAVVAIGVFLDFRAPVVVSVYSDKSASPFDGQYTVGEEIPVLVSVSQPVLVVGIPPRIRMDVGSFERYAIYDRDATAALGDVSSIYQGGGFTTLVFLYTVGLGDFTSNLTYAEDAIDLQGGFSQILRSSDIPETLLQSSLPWPAVPIRRSDTVADSVKIDSSVVPYVLTARLLTPAPTDARTGVFRAGDIVDIRVEWSSYVIANGRSYINLNVGDTAGRAYYIGYAPLSATDSTQKPTDWTTSSVLNADSLPSKFLFYQYTVQENHLSAVLEYTDIYALHPGLTDDGDPGYIVHAATNNRLNASLDLPVPGALGSLSYGANSSIVDSTNAHETHPVVAVDGRAAYLSDLTIVNPSGSYSTNDTIYITMIFSSPVSVVGGIPSLLLETGVVDSRAFYKTGNNSHTLTFEYYPEPGHATEDLDYVVDRKAFLSANHSFERNGARILTYSSHPHVSADIHLNPRLGVLDGDVSQTAVAGVFNFREMGLPHRGLDYLLRYSTTPQSALNNSHGNSNLTDGILLSTTQPLYVSYSSEFQLRPSDALPHKLIGYAVDIDGDIAVMGAPNANLSVTTIQTVTVTAAEVVPQKQIQVVRTDVDPQPAIIRFHSTADPGVEIAGDFEMFYGLLGPTHPLPANADPAQISAILAFDLPALGTTTVTKEAYIYCACKNAFTWTITFHDLRTGVIEDIRFDASGLVGAGASVVGPTLLQSPAILSGTFTLSANSLVTSPIPFDASVSKMTAAMAELSLSVDNILISPADDTLSREWSITFNDYGLSYETPLMTSNATGLRGGNTHIYTQITRPGYHGPLGIAGTFQLVWRENTTIAMSPRVSADEMKAALEQLPVINYVNVNRSAVSALNSYTWTIEFVDFNRNTPRGYEREYQLNAEPLGFVNNLIATNASVMLESRYTLGDEIRIYDTQRQGAFGEGSGAAYVFQRQNESWIQVAALVGNDTKEGNRFGHSVSVHQDLLLVGAIGGNKNGVPEVQALRCHANDGYFRISFRGWTTDLISANVTRLELIDLIVSDSVFFSNLYSVLSVDIEDWGEGALCSNNTAIITFYSPVDGAAGLYGVDTKADLELLTVINHNLTYGAINASVLEVYEVQSGTWNVHGFNADQQQIGCAYVFRARYDCPRVNSIHCKSTWTQEAQLFPTTSVVRSRFGSSVAVSDVVAVVGAPGSDLERGYVYIYEYDPIDARWRYLQFLSDPLNTEGDHFGSAVAIFGNTIIIGAPDSLSGRGATYVYQRPPIGGSFFSAQTLIPLPASIPLFSGDQYGFSVAMFDNTVIIGAPEYDDEFATYLGGLGTAETDSTSTSTASSSKAKAVNAGAVFVFQRPSTAFPFKFIGRLYPSNVRRLDRFGHSVGIDANNIAVTSYEDFFGNYSAAKTVVEVRTEANYNARRLSGSFRLRWRTTNFTTNGQYYETREIPHNATAPQLDDILEADLPVGALLVSRSRVNVFNGGYSWLVTFMSYEGDVTLFTADTRLLSGTNASVQMQYVYSRPQQMRGLTHYFQRDTTDDSFHEQVFLSPYKHQPHDRCGSSVAMSGGFTIVGCPNRDQALPCQNGGAAFVYDMAALGVIFRQNMSIDAPLTLSSDLSTTVPEGERVDVLVRHSDRSLNGDKDIPFTLQTLDRNANLHTQTFLRHLYGVYTTAIDFPDTVVDRIGLSGKAIARSQFYGSSQNESKWVNGMYDYRAISDYVPLVEPKILLSEDTEVSIALFTTADSILEKPDENVTVAVHSPGLWPSIFGRLYTTVTIVDASDGKVDGTALYSKLYDESADPAPPTTAHDTGDVPQFGSSVTVNEQLGVVFVGSPRASMNGVENAGKVLFYCIRNDTWEYQTLFASPTLSAEGNLFGDAVVVGQVHDHALSVLAIGEPNANRVHLYRSEGTSLGVSYVYERSLSIPEAFLPQHRFGEAGSIAIHGFLLAAGAPGLDIAYVYTLRFNESTGGFRWDDGVRIQSLDYDYDVITNIAYHHRQEFGKAVSMHARTILIGSPYADYDKLGLDLVEQNWQTEGTSILSYGRGKAYLFYRTPAVQILRLSAQRPLEEGEFQLTLYNFGRNETTTSLPFYTTEYELEHALEALSNVDEVTVSLPVKSELFTAEGVEYCEAYGYFYTWTVTFDSFWDEPPLLVPTWNGAGCANCTAFSYPAPANLTSQMNVTRVETVGLEFEQIQELRASDRKNGNRFGYSVAIDNDQIAVGAPYSAAMTTTTWTFETGSLQGWSKTGNAFDFQPTFGDNSYFRSTNNSGGLGLRDRFLTSKTGTVGLYYIGTYEKRPGNPLDYKSAHPNFPSGSSQGDAPRGTLSSEVFIIFGSSITFQIGGGCDLYKEFVELLVDGVSVARHTGKCREQMAQVAFAVQQYHGRAGQLRIVDVSSTAWGHINVDHFQFDWDTDGATLSHTSRKTSRGGLTETVGSGAVYVFHRHDTTGAHIPCKNAKLNCTWTEEIKFTASDKRAKTNFGTSVAVNDAAGVIAVGAPHAAFTGFYKEVPTVHPFQNTTHGASNSAAGLFFPVDSTNSHKFESYPYYTPLRSGASGVWELQEQSRVLPDSKAYSNVGAVYVYSKQHEKLDYEGNHAVLQAWRAIEHAKLQPPDEFAHDAFGENLALSGSTLVVGATGNDGFRPNGGAAYLFNTRFAAIYFSKVEFQVLEGTVDFATVTVQRDLRVYAGEIILEYATSDLTARGVDSLHYTACRRMSPGNRGRSGCGDYEQTNGVMRLHAGESKGGFTVNLIDDECYEKFFKYIQLTLSVPGSAALQGELLTARIRIDDDDFGNATC